MSFSPESRSSMVFVIIKTESLSKSGIFVDSFFENMGPTGFDRRRKYVCKHAGSWGESLKR